MKPYWLQYEELLAPWAARGQSSLGRIYKEPSALPVSEDYRSPYQHDRDRIVHSSAFRRLERKTQVYTDIYQEGDHFRKRLTHTLEVAQIARSIARAMRLNEDLTEAIALSHDIGHAPFGHKGQDILHNLMKNSGGFEHNTQALRIVCLIESRYPDFKGLNLTYELQEAISSKCKKGDMAQDEPLKEKFGKFKNPTLEAQVVDLADSITYCTHDLDDGLLAGTITKDSLHDCQFWVEAESAIIKKHPALSSKLLRYQVVRYIITALVTDLVSNSGSRLEDASIKGVDDVRNHKEKLAMFSDPIRGRLNNLKHFLQNHMYDQPPVKRMEFKATSVLTRLFNQFMQEDNLLPPAIKEHFDDMKKQGKESRIVCDYIAGMTDRFALDEYEDLFNPVPPRVG